MKADGAPVWKSFHLKSCLLDFLLLSQLHFYLTCISDTSEQERSWVRGPNAHKPPNIAYKSAHFVTPDVQPLCTHTCGEQNSSVTKCGFVVWGQLSCTRVTRTSVRETCEERKQAEARRGAAAEQCWARSGRGQRTMAWNWQPNHLQSEPTMKDRLFLNFQIQRMMAAACAAHPEVEKSWK